MSRFASFVLTLAALSLFWAAPALAGRLLSWRFDPGQNRLTFYTETRVQPTAQLIPNPTRIVVDLPGTTLGRPTVNQPIGGLVSNLRVAQFDPFTTRLVIEIAPGYTVDPQQVKVRGITPTQWTVEMPTPQRATEAPSNPQAPPQSAAPRPTSSGNGAVQVTQNGLFVRLNRNGENSQIRVNRNPREQIIAFALPGAELPRELLGQTVAINQYGVSAIQFGSDQNPPQLNLAVSSTEETWQAYYSRVGGGIILLPKGGSASARPTAPSSGGLAQVSPQPPRTTLPYGGAIITGLDVTRDNRQLLIRANRPIQARGNLNRLTGEYEIRVDNAQVAQGLQGPKLENSPLYQVRIRQEANNQVLILAQPTQGSSFGRFFRAGADLFALEMTPGRNLAAQPRPPFSSGQRPTPAAVFPFKWNRPAIPALFLRISVSPQPLLVCPLTRPVLPGAGA